MRKELEATPWGLNNLFSRALLESDVTWWGTHSSSSSGGWDKKFAKSRSLRPACTEQKPISSTPKIIRIWSKSCLHLSIKRIKACGLVCPEEGWTQFTQNGQYWGNPQTWYPGLGVGDRVASKNSGAPVTPAIIFFYCFVSKKGKRSIWKHLGRSLRCCHIQER